MSRYHRPGRGNRFVPAALVALALGMLTGPAAHAQPQLGSALPVPRLFVVTPPGGKAGTSLEVTFAGTDVEEPDRLIFSHPGIKAEPLAPPPQPAPAPAPTKPKRRQQPMGKPAITKFKITIPAEVPVGTHDVRLVNQWGVSNPRAFVVGDLAKVAEKEPNNDVDQAQRVALNSTVNGTMANPTDVDYYVFAGKKGQRVVFSCRSTSIDSRMHPGIEVYDARGRLLAGNRHYSQDDALADCTLPEDGDCYVRLFEFTHTFTQGIPLPAGTLDHFYRLSITTAPWIDAIHPCVVEAGKTTPVTVYGRNLPGGKPDPAALADDRVLEKITVDVTAPAGAADTRHLTYTGYLPPSAFTLDGFEYRVRNDAGSSNPFLLTVSRAPVAIDNGANDTPEKAQGVPVPCEIAGQVEKRRDRDWYAFTAKKGQVLNIELLSDRLGAPTYMYFRLRNPATKQDIMESGEENPNAVPRQFYTYSQDPPVYRFTAPADGKYLLLVASRAADTAAGPRDFYRVRIGPDHPDFQLVALGPGQSRPGAPTVLQGGQESFSLFARRQDGFVGDITLSIEGLPPGVTCAPQTLGGDVSAGRLVVSADPKAAAWAGEVKIKGTATIQGKKVVRKARSGCIVWPSPQPQVPMPVISRIDRGLFLAVRAAQAAYSLTGTLDKPALLQGDKCTLKLKLARLWPDFKTPLTIQPEVPDLPRNLRVNNNQPLNLAGNATEGSLPVVVAPDVQPGTYTLVFRTQAQIPFDKDPAGKKKQPTNVVLPSAPVTLTILPKTVVKLTLSNAAPTIKVGAQAEVVVKVERLYQYAGALKVQLVLPPNTKGVEAAEVVIPPGGNEAKLVLKVPAGTAPGGRGNLVVRATALVGDNKVPTTQEVKFNVNVVK